MTEQTGNANVSMLPDEKRAVSLVAVIAMLRMFGLFSLLPVLSHYAGTLQGQTPLLIAAFHGDSDMVRQLVRWGADLDATGPDGLTAYQVAHRAGDEAVMKQLVDGGADATPAPEPERIAIRYDFALDDCMAYFEYYTDKDPGMRRKRRRGTLVTPAIFVLLGAILAYATSNIWQLVFLSG